jgi:hypothetical protein
LVVNPKKVVYISNPNYNGIDWCKYMACVNMGICDSVWIIVNIMGTPFVISQARRWLPSLLHGITTVPFRNPYPKIVHLLKFNTNPVCNKFDRCKFDITNYSV